MYMGSPSSCGYSMLALRCTRALRARHFLPRASFMVACQRPVGALSGAPLA